jgi:hypothetical protein
VLQLPPPRHFSLTVCLAATMAKLHSQSLSTTSKPTLLHTCAALARLNDAPPALPPCLLRARCHQIKLFFFLSLLQKQEEEEEEEEQTNSAPHFLRLMRHGQEGAAAAECKLGQQRRPLGLAYLLLRQQEQTADAAAIRVQSLVKEVWGARWVEREVGG